MKKLLLTCIISMAFFTVMNAWEVRDTVIVTDEWRYEGQWPEGEGVRYSEKYGLYIGTFKDAEPEGMCLNISLNRKEVYYGGIKDGRRHGYGKLSRPGGFFYEGNFEDGHYEGVGKLFCPDWSIYEGVFHVGKPVAAKVELCSYQNKEELPEFPEYELTRKQLKYMRQTLKKIRNENPFFDKERVDPTFLGMEPDMFSAWVNSQLVYPENARFKKQAGTVKIRFVVSRTGELSDPYVIESSGVPSLDVEAYRAVCASPDWSPAIKDGECVDIFYTFPVIFRLY